MTQRAAEETFPVFPVFLVVDVSGSMAGAPIDAVNGALPQIKEVVEKEPMVGEIARIGLITFADGARCDMPLSDLAYVDVPTLRTGNLTNFSAAFRLAKTEIEDGIRGLGKGVKFHKPVVFFVSDGEHTVESDADWQTPLRALTDDSSNYAAEVVVFGFGSANRDTLGEIATRYCFFSTDHDAAASVKEIIRTLISSLRTTSGMMMRGANKFAIEPDPDKFMTLPVRSND